MRKLVVTAVVVVVSGALARQWLASETESRYEQALAELALLRAVSVEEARYERRLWGAAATTRVTVEPSTRDGRPAGEPAEPFSFDVDHTLRYGPITGAGLGVAVIETTPRLPEAIERAADPSIGAEPLLRIRTVLEFGGGTTTRLDGAAYEGSLPPAGAEGGTRVVWKGIQGRIHTEPGGRRGEGDARLPELAIESPSGSLELREVTLQASLERSDRAVWLGRSDLGVSRLAVRRTESGGDGIAFGVEGASIKSEQRTEGTGALDGLTMVAFRRADAAGRRFTDGEIGFTVRRIDEEVLAELQELSGRAGEETEDQLKARAFELFRRMLKRSPEALLEPVRLRSPSGPITARAAVGFDGEHYDGTANPFWLVVRTRAAAEVELPDDVLEAFLESRIRAELAESGADVGAERMRALAGERLAKLAADGLIVREGGRSRASFSLEKGKLAVNGRSGEEFLRRALEGIFRSM